MAETAQAARGVERRVSTMNMEELKTELRNARSIIANLASTVDTVQQSLREAKKNESETTFKRLALVARTEAIVAAANERSSTGSLRSISALTQYTHQEYLGRVRLLAKRLVSFLETVCYGASPPESEVAKKRGAVATMVACCLRAVNSQYIWEYADMGAFVLKALTGSDLAVKVREGVSSTIPFEPLYI